MNFSFSSRKLIIALVFFCLLSYLIETQQQQKVGQSVLQSQQQLSQLPYTEDIQQFKAKKYNQRLQMVVGCWLLSKEYLDLHKSNYLFFKDLKLKQVVTLKLVKECMKKIDRKDAVLKITQLVGKNVQPAKKYEDLVTKQTIDDIFIEISKLTIANYHHYEPINKQTFNSSAQNMIVQHQQNDKNTSDVQKKQRTTQNVDNVSDQIQQDSQNQLYNLSEFDTFLNDLIKKYNEEFHKLISSKQGLKAKVEEQLKKREKYYFGFIPASSFTHSVFLVTISLSMVFCCTCYKYYKMRTTETQQKKKRISQGNEDPHSHSHSKQKQARKVTRMTQLTMKRKTR